ncbi:MAG: hypothetical protein RL748_3367 [Pseudomonadota bacterium]
MSWLRRKLAAIRVRFGPSLTRRVFLAIAISNIVALLFIFMKIFASTVKNDHGAHIRLTERVSYRLNQFSTEQDARAFGAAWQKTIRCAPYCHTEVWTLDGRRIYSAGIAPGQPQFIGVHGKASQIVSNGVLYDLFRHDGPYWSLRIGKPRMDLSTAYIRESLAADFFNRALVFFIFLLLPLWFTVSRGLSPLRQLASHLGKRAAGDLTPLHFPTRWRELKPLVTALDELLAQLRSKVQREYAFLQDATHELRTPMAVISAQAHTLAKADTPLAKEAAKQQIGHAMARAGHLIAQLSELARVDTQSAQESQLLDIVALVKLDVVPMVQAAEVRQMTLLLDAPDTLPHALEVNTFQSILSNLVNNAIRYGRAGGKIVVTLKRENRDLFLSVADDGPGISLDQREQVFERFFRGQGHEVSGSGLGLAIVRQAANRLQARLELGDGLNGQGCCFSLWIPATSTTAKGNR